MVRLVSNNASTCHQDWVRQLFLLLVIASSSCTAYSPSSNGKNVIQRAFILRHGQTDSNAGGIIQGSSDRSRLTDLGKEQAKQVAMFLKQNQLGTKLSSVYTSPLQRVRQTHQVLLDNQAIPQDLEILQDLREIDFYDWQDQDKETLARQFPESWKAWKAGDPNGLIVRETTSNVVDGRPQIQAVEHKPLLELWERADSVWDELHSKEAQKQQEKSGDNDNNVLIVAHGSLGQALLGTAMGWDATHFRQHVFPNCGLVEIEWQTTDKEAVTCENTSRRPLATRWRWKWPVPSTADEWNTYETQKEEASPATQEATA